MQTTLTPIAQVNSFRPTILVIENNEDNLFYISTALKLFHCHCLTTQNAMMGLSLAQQEQPDLILIDVEMTQMNGIELLKTLRMDWLTRSIPAVAITALAKAQDTEKLIEAGFNDCLVRPYLPKELENIIRSQMANKSLC